MKTVNELPYDAEQSLAQLARNLVFARKKRQWRQQDVCERAGITRTTLRKIEAGDPNVSMKNYLKVMSLFPGIEQLAQVNLPDEEVAIQNAYLEALPLRVRGKKTLDNDF